MKFLKVLILVGLISGCAMSSKMSGLNVGMNKSEVLNIMGPPRTIHAQNNAEALEYYLFNGNYYEIYYVRLVNGQVDKFGNATSFSNPSSNYENVNVIQVQNN